MPAVSIIVPVCETEKYLRRCLDSILAQTFEDFECVVVDDGSPDNCLSICNDYAEMDKRIKVIHQENAGTARARDAGVKASAGEFLMFVDSDDMIPADAVLILYDKQRETGADIVCGNIKFLFKKRETIYEDITDFTNPLEYVFLSLNNGVCGKIYRREIYGYDMYIPALSYGEDLIINAQIFSGIKREKIAGVNQAVYTYDRRTAGITTRQKAFKDMPWREYPPIACYLWMYGYLDKKKMLEDGRVKDVFLRRMLKDGILSYICVKKNIGRDEAGTFYNDYFAPCGIKYEIRYPERIILPMYVISGGLGEFYVGIFNLLRNIRLKLKGMR
ncbi:MAG: glycosyltransferase [Chitinispirillia bacterium]|nr:glycosyltransferase [Chitinispirillia bacterium]